MELFTGIGTSLARVLEASLKVKKYIHVGNSIVFRCVAQHNLQRLLALYPKQLSSSAIQGCLGQLPSDVILIVMRT